VLGCGAGFAAATDMNIFAKSGGKDAFSRPKHDAGWWLLVILIVLLPLDWPHWQETVGAVATLIFLAFWAALRDKRRARSEGSGDDK